MPLHSGIKLQWNNEDSSGVYEEPVHLTGMCVHTYSFIYACIVCNHTYAHICMQQYMRLQVLHDWPDAQTASVCACTLALMHSKTY
jgi:hypothetical protein